MKRLSFRGFAAGLLLMSGFSASAACLADSTSADDTAVRNESYHQRLVRRAEHWNKLIPNIFTLQFAGGIGMFSAGFGWDYGSSEQWETHVLVGFTPKRYNYQTYWTLTLREEYNPWKIRLGNRWSMKPLSVNLAVNSILHGDFWMSEPDRYPHGYYGFSSRVRFHLGLGQRFTFVIPEHKRWISSSLSVYYEVSTCDLYVRQKILNKKIPLKDIITLAVGLQWAI